MLIAVQGGCAGNHSRDQSTEAVALPPASDSSYFPAILKNAKKISVTMLGWTPEENREVMTTNAEQIKKIAALVEVKGIYQEPSGKVTTTEFYKIVITLADESTKEIVQQPVCKSGNFVKAG